MFCTFISASVPVSTKQESIMIKERTKPENKRMVWAELTKVLNDAGPCVKSTQLWRKVIVEDRLKAYKF